MANSPGRKKSLEARPQVVADAAEGRESFFVRAGSVARVPDTPVNDLRAREDGAFLRSGITNSENCVEVLALEFRNRFRALRGNVDANFAHGFDSERADVSAGLASGAVHFVGVATKLAEQAFRHLAAHAVAGAEDENAMCHGLTIMLG